MSDDFDGIRCLFNPYRILIMDILIRNGDTPFATMQQILNLSAGNLASHLRALEKEHFVGYAKSFNGRYPLSTYKVTILGKNRMATFRKWILAELGESK